MKDINRTLLLPNKCNKDNVSASPAEYFHNSIHTTRHGVIHTRATTTHDGQMKGENNAVLESIIDRREKKERNSLVVVCHIHLNIFENYEFLETATTFNASFVERTQCWRAVTTATNSVWNAREQIVMQVFIGLLIYNASLMRTDTHIQWTTLNENVFCSILPRSLTILIWPWPQPILSTF